MTGLVFFAALTALRELAYPGADFGSRPIPKFDKGYLLFVERPSTVTVYGPSGSLQFRTELKGPAGLTAHVTGGIAAASDGTIAASISYATARGYESAVVFLNAAGKQTAVIETKRYVAADLAFDARNLLWSIGWQRDEILNAEADKKDYPLVRRYSRSGAETGAFIPRSLWKTTGEPMGSGLGLWKMAVAKDRIGALVYRNFYERQPEWIEWDFDGNLVSRIPIAANKIHGGRAFTASGRLFAGVSLDGGKSLTLAELDRKSGSWNVTRDQPEPKEWGVLLGSDGEDLVGKRPYTSTQLIWIKGGE